MTKEEAELWIKRLEGGNSDDAYRPSEDLSLVLRLALHSHLKPAMICRFTCFDVIAKHFVKPNGEAVPLERDSRGYEIPAWYPVGEDFELVNRHATKVAVRNNQNWDAKFITVSDRALRQKFQNLVSVYYNGQGKRPEIGDFYFAGLGIEDNKEMRRK